MNRKEVKQKAVDYLNNQIQIIQKHIADLATDVQNDAKSSAGDKHETGLAMMHLEQEKLNAKLSELINMLQQAQKLPEEKQMDKVTLGSVIKTDKAIFYVSVAIPTLKVQNQTVICISPVAPLMQVLQNGKQGDEIVFNKISYQIQQIF